MRRLRERACPTLIEKEGASEKEIQEIGRIASIVGAAAKVMVFAGS